MSTWDEPATPEQTSYYYDLARKTGRRLPKPRSKRHAHDEIDRMKGMLGTSTSTDRHFERRAISRDLAIGRGDSAAVREHEVTGYGSGARWSGREAAR